MTPAFDAAMAECARLRLRWHWYEQTPGPPRILVGNIVILATDDPDQAVRSVRNALMWRIRNARFRKATP